MIQKILEPKLCISFPLKSWWVIQKDSVKNNQATYLSKKLQEKFGHADEDSIVAK